MPIREDDLPTFVTHEVKGEEKTADQYREAMTWLREKGFKGHFFNVPPEIVEEFEELDISEGTDGFYFRVGEQNVMSLWAPLKMDELTPKLRRLIEEKYDMSPEEVVAKAKERSSKHYKDMVSPFTEEEKLTHFKVQIYLDGMPKEEPVVHKDLKTWFMRPQVTAYRYVSKGVKSWEFDPRIGVDFSGKDWASHPLGFYAMAPQIEELIEKLIDALQTNKNEVEKVEKGEDRWA